MIHNISLYANVSIMVQWKDFIKFSSAKITTFTNIIHMRKSLMQLMNILFSTIPRIAKSLNGLIPWNLGIRPFKWILLFPMSNWQCAVHYLFCRLHFNICRCFYKFNLINCKEIQHLQLLLAWNRPWTLKKIIVNRSWYTWHSFYAHAYRTNRCLRM